jgi:hypothetical protein
MTTITNQVPFMDHDAERFLTLMSRKSFSYIGVAMLIRAHLFLAETNRLKPVQLNHILRVGSPMTQDMVDQVVADSFSMDADGYIFSVGVDRTVAQQYPKSPG